MEPQQVPMAPDVMDQARDDFSGQDAIGGDGCMRFLDADMAWQLE